MPRYVSSYAANKRVEDGLKRKQEQIRLDYIRATHRYLDETEKLVDDLIQINVKTPNAFETSCPSSANSTNRMHINSNSPRLTTTSFRNIQQQSCNNPLQQQQQMNGISGDSLIAMLKNRSRTTITYDGTNTDDGSTASKKEIPLPIVKVRGKDVFYQYENQKSNWKKVEPTYRTKVLLQRNDTVANALKQYALSVNKNQTMSPRNDVTIVNSEENSRKPSVSSRRESDFRRISIFSSRRGSRRSSRFSTMDGDYDDEEELNRIPPITELKPQLSPGHTPRMLNGWTIMNWCLWNKQQSKPVWATRRYIERKKRELKRYQAARTATAKQQELPPKPASANATNRESRRKESLIIDQHSQTIRAKSVPVNRLSMTIEEEEEDDVEAEKDENNGRTLLPTSIRPTTSILRLQREDATELSTSVTADESRPKTTQSHRRVALDTFIDTHDNTNKTDDTNNNISNRTMNSNSNHRILINDTSEYEANLLKIKSTGKSVKIIETNTPITTPQNKDINISIFSQTPNHQEVFSDTSSQKSIVRGIPRIPKLAATPINVKTEDNNYDNNRRKSSSVVVTPHQKHKNLNQRPKTTVIFPEAYDIK